MYYIIDFSLVAIAYLSITTFFYSRQPKIPGMRDSLFGVLLYLGIFFAVMDVVVVIMEPLAFSWPLWLVRLIHGVFLISVQLSSALFLSYCLALTGLIKVRARPILFLSLIPFFIVALLLLLPLGPEGIFYLDANHIYHRGALYALMYVSVAFYLLASLTVVLLRRRQLQARKLLCIFSFLGVLFLSMLIQYNRPELLLNAAANALALTLIYHVLEAPSTHMDALTGVLNSAALPLVLGDSFEQDRRSTLLLLPVKSIGAVNASLGMRRGDQLLRSLADHLRAAFPLGRVIRAQGDVFAVLISGGKYWDEARLSQLQSALPQYFSHGQVDLPLEVALACVNSEDVSSSLDMLRLEKYILQLHGENRLPRLLAADGGFRQQLAAAEAMERQLEEAISRQAIQVYYQPIHTGDGALVALEALARLEDGAGGFLPTQEAVELAERAGSIHRLGDIILRQVCAFIRDQGVNSWNLHHIGVNLSALQFVREDLEERTSAIIDSYGVPHSLIGFEITETASASVKDISRTMEKMTVAGYRFFLDDFGKGYANFNNIAQLPLSCVKIDKITLWEAERSQEKMALLSGIAGMLRSLGLTCVGEGVETEAQARLLNSLGVDMQQGYFYSRPLSVPDLLAYVEGGGGHGV